MCNPQPRIKYLKNTKNPCWLSAALSNSREGISSRAIQPLRVSTNISTRHRFRCLPYAFLAGFPKCGTTDLYQKLINHKTVRRPSKKEPHWWTRHRQNGPFSDMVLRVLSLQPHSNVSLKNATMLPQTRDLLKRFYAPFNQRLVELTENEAFLWN
ncbi:hypothetical protein CAPTEDRAFT_202701 [Capitella teleta]|uniref:Sulfotransferase domain-containing protein n=1 Tax=Capitella teleta TaxID=283909 RepID=R7UFZ3_CAPTE|nr:hypothetical protein CAPTEDRAFT_202701 [Capitella teleta]|eukprot:ELU05454.1 hypothetical protein CAPTEDRAFT_202701 [Capitella teleta]